MHVYIYDDFVNQKKYEQAMAAIETRITDLGLSGKIIRLGILKNIRAAIADELRQGAKTIVAVGNNNIINTAVNAMVGLDSVDFPNKQTPLAIIPVGKKNNEIASALGIEAETAACDILSARRIEMLSLGKANDFYFLAQAFIDTKHTILEIDQSFTIEIAEPGIINITNLLINNQHLPQGIKSDPTDNELELVVTTTSAKKYLRLSTRNTSQSLFNFSYLNIINPANTLRLDNSIELSCPVEIKVANTKLPIIVGKNRVF